MPQAAGAAACRPDRTWDAIAKHSRSQYVVIGPSDLDRPEVLALAWDALAVGRTVAITEANQREADRFHRLMGGIGNQANCEEDSDVGIALYGLQQATTRVPAQLSS